MTRKNSSFPCSPDVSPSPRYGSLSNFNFTGSLRLLIVIAVGLLCVAPTASAQTRSKRVQSKREERARRVETNKQPKVKEISKRVNWTKPTAPPAIRKTVIVSAKRTDGIAPPRESLVNDIVIISEAPVSSRLPSAPSGVMGARTMPSGWPVAGAMRGGFGFRRNPFGGSGSEFHKGQDISAPMGTPVIATADGVVTNAGWLRGYGRVVYVDHGNGLSTRYGHLSRIDVIVGQSVQRGGQLGLVGSTGRSTGPHLHYEVRVEGQATNPVPYLPAVPLEVAPQL
jgi:murein DD-endopeptidase MepM/ murein hydrolase activator NlpD